MESTKAHFRTLEAALRCLREELHDRVEAQTMMTLLLVQRKGEVTGGEISKELGITDGAASRNIARLCKGPIRAGGEGYDLVTREEDVLDRRNKIVRLNARGKALMDRLDKAMSKAYGKANKENA